jgi:hypothetical protein
MIFGGKLIFVAAGESDSCPATSGGDHVELILIGPKPSDGDQLGDFVVGRHN